jgi:hypothetical protein
MTEMERLFLEPAALLSRLYQHCNGVSFDLRGGRAAYRLLPLEEMRVVSITRAALVQAWEGTMARARAAGVRDEEVPSVARISATTELWVLFCVLADGSFLAVRAASVASEIIHVTDEVLAGRAEPRMVASSLQEALLRILDGELSLQ